MIGNLTSRAGFSLIKIAEELDERTIGNCIIRDADVNVITLLDWAKDHGVESIHLVFPPCSSKNGKRGLILTESHEPSTNIEAVDPARIVKDLWMNLTGSLNKEDVVSALKILSQIPFKVYECIPEDDGCDRIFMKWLKETCNA